MRPTTLSASALQAASMCLKRFQAEYVKRGRGMGGEAAKTGSAVHGALEFYVKYIVMAGVPYEDLHLYRQNLLNYYDLHFERVFGSLDKTRAEYMDGRGMLSDWHANYSFVGRTVLTVEVKDRWPIKLSDGTVIPLSYIWDRQDRLDDGSIAVVDYKSNRMPLAPGELRDKVQAKVYAMIASMIHPTAPGIWVEFHMLRHEITRVYFTRADCDAIWTWFGGLLELILTTEDPEPTLNVECNFCVMKTTCPELKKNVEVGGAFSLSPQEMVDKKEFLVNIGKAVAAAEKELDAILGPLLRPDDGSDNPIEGTAMVAAVAARSVRTVDMDLIRRTVPREILEDHLETKKPTIDGFEKIVNDPRLSDEASAILRRDGLRKSPQTPSIKLTPRKN